MFVIECMGWLYLVCEWILRKLRYWLKVEIVEKILMNGFMIVLKFIDIFGDIRREWRLFFFILEGVLFDIFDECYVIVYYMFCLLYVNFLKEWFCGILILYYFKIVMFWMFEEIELSCWFCERIVDNFLCVVKKFY